MCSGPNPAYAASSLDPSTPTYINTERTLFFLNQPQKFLLSPACGFATTGNLLCAGVGLLPLSWTRVREKTQWLHNSSSLMSVQDTASWSEELAGVGVI